MLVLLVEQLVEYLGFDRDIFALFFDLYVQGVYSAPVLLTNNQSKVIFVIELTEDFDNQFFTQLMLLVVFEVAVKNKCDASLADHVVA